jgi:hypothetical protein
MEKRVAGIIRWLERCLKAYKAGAVESALMDVECARADIESLREDLWAKIELRHSDHFFLAPLAPRARRLSVLRPLAAFLWAFGMTLAAATPLSQDRRANETQEGRFTLEWVTPDEMELLGNIRKRPDDSLAMTVTSAEPLFLPGPAPLSPPETRLLRAPVQAKQRGPEKAQETQKIQKIQKIQERASAPSVPYDRIMLLVETGERAMKNQEPAIKVEK